MRGGIGNRRSSADDAKFTNAFRPHRVDMRVVLINPGDVDGADIGVGGDVILGKVMVYEVTKAGVKDALLVQGHREAHCHATKQLRASRFGVDDVPGGEDTEQSWHADLAGILVDVDFGELRAKSVH